MHRNWSTAEMSRLDQLLGLPLAMVVEQYNEWAIANGYRIRTEMAIQKKIVTTLKDSSRFTGTEGLKSAICWAEELGLHKDTLYYYIRCGLIRHSRRRKHILITRKSMLTFARNHPRKIRDVSRDILVYVFGEGVGEELYRKAHSMAN